MGLRSKLALSLGAIILVTFALVYFATSKLVTSILMEQEVWSLYDGTGILVDALYTLVQDQDELNSALLSAAETGGMDTVQVLDERLETVSPSACTPAEILLGRERLEALVEKGATQLVHSPSLGDVFALVRPLPGGGYLFTAKSAAPYFERRQSVVTLLILWGALVLLAVLLAGLVLLRNIVARPIEKLVREAGKIATGKGSSLNTLEGDEFGILASSLAAMARRIREDRLMIERQVVELTDMNKKLTETTEQLIRTEKLASVGQLAAGVAHEIGNPIGVTLGYIEMLENGGLDDDAKKDAIAQIRKATERISRTIRDLLDFSRPAQDEEERSNAIREAEEIVSFVRAQPRFRNVRLNVVHSVDGDLFCAIPPSRLKQVFLNLLINSADAMDGSGTIEISLSRNGEEVHACVSDSGPGIDPSILLRIFDPFFTTKDIGKGTGLGLFVCHTIVTRYGGRIEVGKSPLGGASFTVVLPCCVDNSKEA